MFKHILLILFIILIIFGLSNGASDRSRAIIHDVPDEVKLRQFPDARVSQLTRQDSLDIGNYRYVGGTFKVLVFLVKWAGRSETYPVETFEEMFFSRGTYPGGSIADYFDEVSYGQISFEGEIRTWHNVGTYSNDYNFGNLLYTEDMFVDYSQFDGNGDGVVDAVIFIRSGNGMEDTGDPNDIWSYAMSYPMGEGYGPFDGVMVSRWCTAPETYPLRGPVDPTEFSGVDEINVISTALHELTHNLGLPDLYDYDAKLDVSTFSTPNDDNDHPFVDWCLMGYNGYGLMAIKKTSPHICGWGKEELGWISPVILDGPEYTDLIINNIETTNENSLFQIPIGGDEYFLLEYRNPQSTATFDKVDSDFSVYLYPDLEIGNDTLDRGLMIAHVDGSINTVSRFNNGTPEYPHYAVAVEDAGYNPARDATTNPLGHVTDSAQWWYPYETRKAALFSSDVPGQELFSPMTYPNSDGYSGPSGVVVLVDSIVDDRLFAFVAIDPDFDGYLGENDNCPDAYNPDQVNSDTDEHGDLCDNCPFYDNSGQADNNFDNIGDACTFNTPVAAGSNIDITLNNVELTFENALSSGSAEMTITPDGPGPLSFKIVSTDLPVYYNITSDVSYSGAINICITYDDAGMSETTEQSLSLLHYDEPAWANIAVSLDTESNIICGQTSSLSPFAVAMLDYICGDADNNDLVDILDIVYIINHKYKDGPEPIAPISADVNKDQLIDILDIVFLINYKYKDGATPFCRLE